MHFRGKIIRKPRAVLVELTYVPICIVVCGSSIQATGNLRREAWHRTSALGSFEGQGKRPHFLVVDAGRARAPLLHHRSSTDSLPPSSMVANECVALHDRIDSER